MVIIIKPTYSCNFRCKYCYLGNSTKESSKMFNASFVQNAISQIKDYVIEVKSRKKVTFIWHGGEPLLWGVENFRLVFEFMEDVLSDIDYSNSIQTNLSLLTEEYVDLFLKYNVHVGFSVDGFRELNDSQRVLTNGRGTYDLIIDRLNLARAKGLSMGCIIVGTKNSIGRVEELYKFVGDNRLNFKFNPLFISGEARNNDEELGITTGEYADMTIELFDLWYNDTENRITESNFVEIASNILTGHTSGCLFGKNCQENFFAIAPTGDVFPCGRFCDESTAEFSYGNLHNESLTDILTRAKKSDCYNRYKYIEESSCRQCEYFHICHGGCLHDGYLRSGDFRSKTFLCSAYKRIFKHIKERITETGLTDKAIQNGS